MIDHWKAIIEDPNSTYAEQREAAIALYRRKKAGSIRMCLWCGRFQINMRALIEHLRIKHKVHTL